MTATGTASGAGGAHLLGIDAGTYRRHPLHGEDRQWSETNCYTDLWIELLHALGTEPLAMAAFTLAADFEGTQWAFFKPPLEDLEALYGILTGEMNVWRPVFDHVIEELQAGRLVTVEVDAWHLPDTAGTSYRTEHVKTSIVAEAVDAGARRMGYFHSRGYHELGGEDFDALVRPALLPPYAELIRLPERMPAHMDLVERSVALLAHHLRRLPSTNPVARMAERLTAELPSLLGADPGRYHLVAFATLRQCGASMEVASSYLEWLGAETGMAVAGPAGELRRLAGDAKATQFLLARAARGRAVDLGTPLASMASSWDRAMTALDAEVTLAG